MRVLLIEDHLGDRMLIETELQRARDVRFDVHHASTLGEGVQLLQGQPFDAVIVDLNLPDSRGVQTVQVVRLQARDLPIVVLTGSLSRRIGTRAIQAGGDEYLSKVEISGGRLIRAIDYARHRHRSRRELERAKDRVLSLSARIETTGELAENVAHEITNLLAVVQSYAELIADDAPAAMRGDVDAIRDATVRGTSAVQRLRALTGNDEGQSAADETADAAATDDTSVVAGPWVAENESLLPGVRILVVDDEPMFVRATVRLLQQAGAEVTGCATADDALRALETGDFEVLVTDLKMPQLTGDVLAQRARNVRPGIRIVMMSGGAEIDTAALAVDGVPLRKPFGRDELCDAIAASVHHAA